MDPNKGNAALGPDGQPVRRGTRRRGARARAIAKRKAVPPAEPDARKSASPAARRAPTPPQHRGSGLGASGSADLGRPAPMTPLNWDLDAAARSSTLHPSVIAAQAAFEKVPPTPVPPGGVKRDRKRNGGKGGSRSRSVSQGGKGKNGKPAKGKGKELAANRVQHWGQKKKGKGKGRGKGQERTVSINSGKDASQGAGSQKGR